MDNNLNLMIGLNLYDLPKSEGRLGEPTDLTHNTKPKTIEHKQNVLEYVYFTSPIKIEPDYYDVELATERIKGQDKNLLDLYNVRVKKKDPTNTNLIASSQGQFNNTTSGEIVKTDTEYLDAVNSGDMAKAQAMVDARAREMGYNSPKLYHGTQDFGFTEVDVSKSDDTTSFFATDSLETAETYSGKSEARQIGRRDAEEISRKVDEAWDKFKGAAQKFLDMLNKTDPKNFDITDPNDLITKKEWQDIGTLNDEELPNFVNGVLNRMSNMFQKAVNNNERLHKANVTNTFGVFSFTTFRNRKVV